MQCSIVSLNFTKMFKEDDMQNTNLTTYQELYGTPFYLIVYHSHKLLTRNQIKSKITFVERIYESL